MSLNFRVMPAVRQPRRVNFPFCLFEGGQVSGRRGLFPVETLRRKVTLFVIASVFLEMQALEWSEFDGHRRPVCRLRFRQMDVRAKYH